MTTEQQLLVALDVLTHGAVLPHALPRTLRTDAFATEAAVAGKENRTWVHGRGIEGFGIAEKIAEGKLCPELSLKVYVTEKLPEKKLKSRVKIPKTIRTPRVSKPLPTDVEAIGKIVPEENTRRIRPVMPASASPTWPSRPAPSAAW